MKTQHTPTLWKVFGDNQVYFPDSKRHFDALIITDANGCEICAVHGNADPQQSKDAAFIVRAVNSHDALVEALEALFEHCAMIHKYWGEGDNSRQADAAISQARAALAQAKEP